MAIEVDFRSELERVAHCKPMEQARLIRILSSGRAPRSLLQKYARQLFAGAFHFPLQLAKLLRITTSPTARLHILENLMEETGAVVDINHGLRLIEQNRHTAWAERFVIAAGLNKSDCDMAVENYHIGSFEERIGEKDWLAAIAYLLVGIESNAPQTYLPIVDGLLKSGFGRDEIVFFTGHIVADAEHGETGIRLLAELTPPERRQEILDSVSEGAHYWWKIHHESGN
ncbi:MAG: iron-containing redox enzyme family protein [Candidatus Sedimenticola sp. 20ELBAFRAG]